MPYDPTQLNNQKLIHQSIEELYQKNGSYLSQRVQSLKASLKKSHHSPNFNQIMQGLYDTQYIQSKLLTKKFKSNLYNLMINLYTKYQNTNDNLDLALQDLDLKDELNKIIYPLKITLPSNIRSHFNVIESQYLDQVVMPNQRQLINGILNLFDIHYELSLEEADQLHYIVLSNQMKNQYYYFLDSYLTDERIDIEIKRLDNFIQKKPKYQTAQNMRYAYQQLKLLNHFIKSIESQIDQWYLHLTNDGQEMIEMVNQSLTELINLHQAVIDQEVYNLP